MREAGRQSEPLPRALEPFAGCPLLSIENIAKVFEVRTRTIQRWREAGKFPKPDIEPNKQFQRWMIESIATFIRNKGIKP